MVTDNSDVKKASELLSLFSTFRLQFGLYGDVHVVVGRVVRRIVCARLVHTARYALRIKMFKKFATNTNHFTRTQVYDDTCAPISYYDNKTRCVDAPRVFWFRTVAVRSTRTRETSTTA